MPDKPERVCFFAEEFGERRRPTVTIYDDGTYKEHRPVAKATKVTVLLYKNSSVGPTRIQLDMAERLASGILCANPRCVVEFGPETSPWTYEWVARSMGDDIALGFAGTKELKWGKKGRLNSGVIRYRKKPKYEPKQR